jgi:hypothetical protein
MRTSIELELVGANRLRPQYLGFSPFRASTRLARQPPHPPKSRHSFGPRGFPAAKTDRIEPLKVSHRLKNASQTISGTGAMLCHLERCLSAGAA